MNLSQFMNQVELLTNAGTQEQLKAFIHESARVLPEKQREDFLKLLKTALNGQQNQNSISPKTDLSEKYKMIDARLKEIEEQEKVLYSDINEEYYDWYNSGEDEFLYEDQEEIIPDIINACQFVHECLDKEVYQYGAELGERLLLLEIYVDSEYGEEMFSLKDLLIHDLMKMDLKKLLYETLYCVYKYTSIEECAERMYDIIENSADRDVSLEQFLQFCPSEMENQDEFLDYWIDELELRTGKLAEKLFYEAAALKNDEEASLSIAMSNINNHPGLIEKILERNTSFEDERMLKIGLESLEAMNPKYVIRSRIALLTAKYAEKCQDVKAVKKCLLCAFESDTIPKNYLRYFIRCQKEEAITLQTVEQIKKPLRELIASYSFKELKEYRSYSDGELKENEIAKNTLLLLLFLDGQFEEVLEKGMKTENGVGWSGSFLKIGFALCNLYLYDGKTRKQGIEKMYDDVRYVMGFSGAVSENGLNDIKTSYAEFDEIFRKWKDATPMSETTAEKMIQKLEKMVKLRVDGIMSGNHRKYYGECAAYIAALGEVKESRGEKGAKQRYMEDYRRQYSRRYAFRDELKNYGLRAGPVASRSNIHL